MYAFWVILTASLVAVACSLLGCFLVLRRMAMVADAISHSILPGIIIAFLFTGTYHTGSMLLGAGVVGFLTTLGIEFLHKRLHLQTDAAIGVTFTTLFSVGVILISAFAEQVDLDQECVLYGEIAYVPLELYAVWGSPAIPMAVWTMGGVLLLIILFIVLFFKELQLTSFDHSFAKTVGMSTQLWHYCLMGLVAVTTVAAFESVGAILVVALMIVPAAIAHLFSPTLKVMLWLASVVGIVMAVLGYYLAVLIDGSMAGAMATVGGVMFAVAAFWVNIKKKHKLS